MMRLSAIGRIACLLAFIILQSCGVSNAQDSSSSSTGPLWPSSGQPAVITAISGCTDLQNGTTVNCMRSARLVFHGSGFLTGLEDKPYPFANFVFQIGSTLPYAYCQNLYGMLLNDTFVECTVYNVQFRQYPPDQIVEVRHVNYLNKNYSQPFWGISFAYEPLPTLERISGCGSTSPDGKSVYNCNVETDLITLIGSGFSSASNNWIIMTLGDEFNYVDPAIHSDLLINFTDTMIVLSFADSYNLLSEVDAAKGEPIRFSLSSIENDEYQKPVWSLSDMYIQFAQLPNPVITNLSLDSTETNCTLDMSTGSPRFLNCVPGISQIQISGRFLYKGVSISVGGLPAKLSVWVQQGARLTVVLPVDEFAAGQFYDLTVSTLAGSATWKGVIQFSTNPLIAGVTPCIDLGYDYSVYDIFYGRCLAGEKLTVSVLNVKNPQSPRVLITNYNQSIPVYTCNAQMLDSRTVQCTMPLPPPSDNLQIVWGVAYISVQFADGKTTNSLSLQSPFDTPGSPRLSSITGCYTTSSDPLQLNQCLAIPNNTVILTLRGVGLKNLYGQNWSVTINFNVKCGQPLVIDDHTLTCLLPSLDRADASWLELDTPYPIIVTDLWNRIASNAGYITFVQSETHDTARSASSSSASTATIVLSTVFSVLGGALLLLVGFVLYRRRCLSNKRHNGEASESFESSATRHVELSEV